MKQNGKRAWIILTVVLAVLGIALVAVTVNACRAYNNVLFIGGGERRAILEAAQAAGETGTRLTVFRSAYWLLLAGCALLGGCLACLARLNRVSEKCARTTRVLLTSYRPLVILVLVTAVFSCLHVRFFSVGNFTNILKQISHYAILASGVYFAILLGGIDISVGSVLAFSGAMGAWIITNMPENPWSAALAILAALAIGLGAGAANGFFVARCGLQPMIVTLATMSIFRGATLVLTNGAAISLNRKLAGYDVFAGLGQNAVFNGYLPIPIIIMAVIYAIVYYLLNKTAFGRHMYAIGGNEEASLLSGINVGRVKILAYTASGLMAAVAGVLVTARVASATPTAGQSYEMDAIAAVVIGGTSLRGGEGKVLYTIIGALIIGMLNNILNLTNVSSYYQTIVKGFVILGAVMLDARSIKKT